jgi:outer membrane protein OmpA-like peptidoglycan-associated protein
MTAHDDFLTLKNVLFGPEAVILQELRRLVARHDLRIGSQERLCESIAAILADALKSAGVQNRQGLALALAPVIAESIRVEIRQPGSGMVEALHPITGRLTAVYVASAFRNFAAETNRRLESLLTGRYVRLKLKSLITGTPYRELLLQETGAFRVHDIVLMDTEQGVLLDRLSAPGAYSGEISADEDGAELSHLLVALHRTATEAPGTGYGESLVSDAGASKLYWRSFGRLLLAVRAAGTVDRQLLQSLDNAIRETLEIYGRSIQSANPEDAARAQRQALLSLAERLPQPQEESLGTPVLAYALLMLLLAALFGWAGWTGWERFEAQRIYQAALGVVQSNPGAAGYPVSVAYDSARPALTVSGLVPTPALKEELEKDIKTKVPGVPLESKLIALSDTATAKVDELQRQVSQALARLNDLAANRTQAAALPGTQNQALAQALARLDNLDRTQGQMLARLDNLDQARGQTATRLDKLDQALIQPVVQTPSPDRALSQVIVRLDSLDRIQSQTVARLDKLDQARSQAANQPVTPDQAQNLVPARLDSLDRAQSQTAARLDHLDQGRSLILARLDDLDRGRAQLTARLDGLGELLNAGEMDAKLQSLTKELAALSAGSAEQRAARPGALPEASSPDQDLAAWAARNAIFFGDQTQFRDPLTARRQLSELKDLLAGTTVRLRLIGYTDPLGDTENNNRLALERAKAIAGELDKIGIPASRLILAGRAKEGRIASDQGPDSANRRVEFQLAFAHE